MAVTMIKEFFNGRYFNIPKYQRSYAWDENNVRDLINDLIEAIELGSNHYIGTVVLSRNPDKKNSFNIVDGQQRATTLTLLLNELIKRLKEDDRNFYYRFYIKDRNYRINPLNVDTKFFHKLLEDEIINPKSNSQKRLITAKNIINDILDTLTDFTQILEIIEELQLMEFIQENDGEAIRIFQTVNDRGKLLTNMEKAKSLLVYYSNRFLVGKQDDLVNKSFGDMFMLYDSIKEISEKYDISLISNVNFNEDNIMRYHFITFTNIDYDATPEYVLSYIKSILNGFKKKKHFNKMSKYIRKYNNSLHSFFKNLKSLLELVKSDFRYLKFFSILGPNTNLYPLIVSLYQALLLDETLLTNPIKTFLDLVIAIDIRVYKIRGTDPRAEISRFAYRLNNDNLKKQDIENYLIDYLSRWMNENEYRNNLNTSVYQKCRSILPYTLLEYSEFLGDKLTHEKLLSFIKNKNKSITIEHILAQHPTFNPVFYNFQNIEEYYDLEHKLGNLSIIEKTLNSSAQNKNPLEKIKIYDKSNFKITTKVANTLSMKKNFQKDDIIKRTKEIVKFIYNMYSI